MTHELRREVAAARRRKRRWWAASLVAIVLPAQAITMMYVLQPREHVRVVHTSSVDIVAMPVPLPIEHTVNVPLDRTTCPPPRTDAQFVAPASVPEAVERVRPSDTNAGWIAAWNTEHVFISTDGGATWRRRLDAASIVQDVAFDCFGRAIVLRGNQLGMYDGDVERWAPVPRLRPRDAELGSDDATLLGGGPDIVVIGHSTTPADEPWNANLLVSRDLGATWQHRQLTGYWEGDVRGRQHEDGTIRATLTIPDCMSEFALAFRWKDGVFETIDTSLDADLAFFGDRMVSSHGWQKIGSDVTHDLPGMDERPTLIAGGPAPIFVTNAAAWRFDGKRLTRLPWRLGGDELGLVADPAGRMWSVRCGQPRIATRSEQPPCE